jgi:hypothetical protein
MRKDAGDCGLKVEPPWDGCCSAVLQLPVASLIQFIGCIVTVLPL